MKFAPLAVRRQWLKLMRRREVLRVELRVPLASLVVVVVCRVDLAVDRVHPPPRGLQRGVRRPQLLERWQRVGYDVHVGKELRAHLLHLVPAQRPAADARGVQRIRHRRQPQAAHLDRQPRLLHRARALSMRRARRAHYLVERCLHQRVMPMRRQARRRRPHDAHEVVERGVGAEAVDLKLHLQRQTALGRVPQLVHVRQRSQVLLHPRQQLVGARVACGDI